MQRLQVVVAHRPPFVFVTNTSGGAVYFSGLLVDLLNRILLTGNVSYQYDMYMSPQNAGGTLSNGKWNGVIGELVAQRADVALFPLTRTASRLAVIDCTFSYYDAGLALLVSQEQTVAGPLSVLAPFSLTLWVTLLCTVVAVALLFWALSAYGRWIRKRQLRALRTSGVLSESAVARAGKGEQNPVLISFMAAAGAPERPGRSSWGVQVLYVVYCFFCLIVLSSYTANLTSYLAVQRMYTGVNGLEDLVKADGFLGVNPNGSTAAYFAVSQDSLATQLQPRVRYCDSTTCVSWVRQGVVQAFVTDEPVLLYLSQQQPCDTAVVGDPFGPGNLVLGLQKNSSLLPLFNHAIQSFSEDGTLTSLKRTWFDGLSQCASDAQLNNSHLSVTQMLGAFVFLVMGILVAFSIGTVENLKWCVAKAYARSYSESGHLQNARSISMPRQSESGQLQQQQQPRASVLLQQASRLRAATFRRLSVSLLGISHNNLPPANTNTNTDDRPSEAGWWEQHTGVAPKEAGATDWPAPPSPFQSPPRHGPNAQLRLSFGGAVAPYRRTSDPALLPRASSGYCPAAAAAIPASASFKMTAARGRTRPHHSHAGHVHTAFAASSSGSVDNSQPRDRAPWRPDGGGDEIEMSAAAAAAAPPARPRVGAGGGRGGGGGDAAACPDPWGFGARQPAGIALLGGAVDAAGSPLLAPPLRPVMTSVATLRNGDIGAHDSDDPLRRPSSLGHTQTTSLARGTGTRIAVPVSTLTSMPPPPPAAAALPPPTPGATPAAAPSMSRMSSLRSLQHRVAPSLQVGASGARRRTEDGRQRPPPPSSPPQPPPPPLQEAALPSGQAPQPQPTNTAQPAAAAAATALQQPRERPQPRPQPPLSTSSCTARTFPYQDDGSLTSSEVSGSGGYAPDADDGEGRAAVRVSISFTTLTAASASCATPERGDPGHQPRTLAGIETVGGYVPGI